MLLWFRQVLALAIKELRATLKDRKSRFVVIAPPILQFFVFGYAATFDVRDVAWCAVDEDRSPESRDLLRQVSGSPSFSLVGVLPNAAAIDAAIDARDARLVLRIGSDFAERLHEGRPASVQVLLDGRNSNVAGIALGYLQSILDRWSADRGGAVQVVERAWFNPNLESRWFIVSGLPGQLALVVVLLLTGLSVAREREQGTFEQTLVAPLGAAQILIGKSIPAFVFGLGDGILLSAAAIVWFGVPMTGTWTALVAVLGVYVIALLGIGLFISSLATTMQQALLGAFLFIMPAVILSGLTTPIQNMPDWLQIATMANPARYVVEGCRAVFLEGADLGRVLRLLIPMLVVAAVTLPAAGLLFRHRTR